jgi:hypothetical protein
MAGLALMALLTSFLLRSRLRRETIAGVAVPMTAILSSFLVYTFILSLIHISSFHVIHVQYLFPGSALLLILIFLSIYLAAQLLRGVGPARELDL